MSESRETAVATVPSAALPATLLDQYKGVIAQSQEEAKGMTKADFSMPFLAVVQSLSPQRQRGDAKYIEGAEEGDFFDTVTAELIKGAAGIDLIPVKYELRYNVWRPRDNGGGFLGSFETEAEALTVAVAQVAAEIPGVGTDTEKAKTIALARDKTGWVRDTANQYVLAKTPAVDGFRPVLLSLTSTKLTPGRKWNTVISIVKPGEGRPAVRWDKVWHLVTVQAKNQKNQPFYNITVPRAVRDTTLAEWQQAADFYKMLLAGQVKVEYEKAADAEAEVVDDGGPAM